MMVTTVPVIAPLVASLGYDLVWFGILMVVLSETGMITPPFGINLFVVQAVRGKGPLSDVIIGAIPFVVALLTLTVLLLLWPIAGSCGCPDFSADHIPSSVEQAIHSTMNLRVRRVVTGHVTQRKGHRDQRRELARAHAAPGSGGDASSGPSTRFRDRQPRAGGWIARGMSTTMSNGVVFRVMRYEGGTAGRMHRTNSMDYAVILSGSIVLELDDGAEVALHAGDVLVQRGTMHSWIKSRSQPCTIAFVLIDALPISSEDRAGG